MTLKPFIRYYGGKWRAAPKYPAPMHRTIIEPFAGAAGYACRYPDRDVVLVERYPVLAAVWCYLIHVTEAEIRSIPEVEHVDDLPARVCQEAAWLVGWWLNAATVSPCKQLSSGRRDLASRGRNYEGWTPHTRERIASQLIAIRHWRVIEGDYTQAPDVPATWFIDPPYNNAAGSHYVHGPKAIDYKALASWCQSRQGQVIVCENEGAAWLPFQPFGTFKAGVNNTTGGSREVVWFGGVDNGRIAAARARGNEWRARNLEADSGR